MISRGMVIFIRHFVMTQEDNYLIYRDTINDYHKVSDVALRVSRECLLISISEIIDLYCV